MTLEEFNTNRYGLYDLVKTTGKGYILKIIGVDFENGIFYLQDIKTLHKYDLAYYNCELVKEDNMTREETVVLTTLYNMLSGHFKTNKKAILTCFDPSKHKEVINALLMLKSKSIIYINETPFDWNHYINWDVFKDEMINQELRDKGL